MEFLRQVAEHYSGAEATERLCFIFPNRRSQLFFKEYFRQAVSSGSGAGRPVLAPRMFTINDFFYALSGQKATDKVILLLELYSCYARLNRYAESLDDFIFWGDVLLGDFDDVDKFLADPVQLFRNVSDLKAIQDSYEYLTEGQRQAIEHFVGHFREGKSVLSDKITAGDISSSENERYARGASSAESVSSLKDASFADDASPVKNASSVKDASLVSDKAGVKEKFLQIWNIMLPLYRDFRAVLEKKGLSYEGMVYRQTAERLDEVSAADILSDAFGGSFQYVFVGLNALNGCEKKLLRKMRDAGVAQFCWDYSSQFIKNPKNKSSLFLRENVELFPQAFELDTEGLQMPELNVLSVPSSVGQAKQVPGILERLADAGCVSDLGMDTAIILPDETLLLPVLNSLPYEVKNINVTMGYPMKESAFWSLMNDISSLQMHLRQKDGAWYFYHKQLWSILSCSIIRTALGEEMCGKLSELRKRSSYYVSQSELCVCPLLEVIFRPAVKNAREKSAEQTALIEAYLKDVVLSLAPVLREDAEMSVELEFAKAFYLAVGKLQNIRLELLPATFFRLLSQIVSGMSVPFTGEPLNGLQIMGPLEMRAIDFDNVIVLSCNEGMFPHRSFSSSFVPPELRQCFGLPTYEYQDAVWAYYFYRVIQRAKKVWLVYDSRTEGMKGGEESRYIKQLELHFNLHTNRFVAKAPIADTGSEEGIVKTEEDVEVVRNTYLSASALQNYLSCPAKFYYHTVCKLKPDEEVSESLDAGMIGNVYHAVMQALYFGPEAMDSGFSMERSHVTARLSERQSFVSREYIREWLGRRKDIKARIRSLVMAELKNTFEVVGKNLIFEDVVLQYVLKTLSRDLEYMEKCGVERFEVLGLELGCYWEYEGYRFHGYIDRLDSFVEGVVRVVDYKTGKVEDQDVDIDDENALKVVESLFREDNPDRPKIAMQLFLYDMFVENHNSVKGKRIVNSIYPPAKLFVSPVLDVERSTVFTDLMKDRLKHMLEEISDISVNFRRTTEPKTCSVCDFKTICGR